MALNAAIKRAIFADPEAYFVTRMAFPFGSTRAFPTAHALLDGCSLEIGKHRCDFRFKRDRFSTSRG